MMKVVLASSNAGKIQELQTMLNDLDVTIIPQTKLQVIDAEETGLTFVENALIKARHACEQTGLPALADDSGLTVAALQGAPGIYSARYAGANASSEDNITKLLQVMQHIPLSERHAAYYCVLVFMTHAKDPTPIICTGSWQGEILSAPQGKMGFGYDPVFYVPKENKTAAELPLHVKNQLSHRGQALHKLLKKLTNKI
ncbi:MAG: RdgB/HAM1 family non-canonical purine NTP pyrophosphatase [Pseudomonadota bacterium]